MTEEQIEYYMKQAATGELPDEKNPLFILQTVHTDLLVKIVSRDFNITSLASRELSQRGLNDQGKYVGFGQVKTAKKSVKRKGKSL